MVRKSCIGMVRLTPSGTAMTAARRAAEAVAELDRLTPSGTAMTAAAWNGHRRKERSPPHAFWNCDDCGFHEVAYYEHHDQPPHAFWNCDDCGRRRGVAVVWLMPASRLLELR